MILKFFKLKWIIQLFLILVLVSCKKNIDNSLLTYLENIQPHHYPKLLPSEAKLKLIDLENLIPKRDIFSFSENKPDNTICNEKNSEAFLTNHFIRVLKMVGVIKYQHTLHGLIASPDNQIYLVKENNYLGRECGRIKKITNDKIILEKRIMNMDKIEKHSQTLSLDKKNRSTND